MTSAWVCAKARAIGNCTPWFSPIGPLRFEWGIPLDRRKDASGAYLDQAVRLASRDGLDGLTIGTLSAELGLSKSGLFSHFGSKDELQLQVLQAAVERFEIEVIRPALAAPRGEPRIRALFERWLTWVNALDSPGGCILIAAAVEQQGSATSEISGNVQQAANGTREVVTPATRGLIRTPALRRAYLAAARAIESDGDRACGQPLQRRGRLAHGRDHRLQRLGLVLQVPLGHGHQVGHEVGW